VEPIPFTHWSVQDWVAHYAGPTFDPTQAEAGSVWDHQGRRMPGHPGHHHAPGHQHAFNAGQQPSVAQRAQQAAHDVAQHGTQAFQSTMHNATSLVHHSIEKATSPGVLIAGVAIVGILGWVFVQQSKTVGRTIEGVAPHAAKALPLLAM